MESFIGMAIGIGLVAVGFGLGVLFMFRSAPPAPKSDGLGSAVILLKQVTDKAVAESSATREFSTAIVTRLLENNDKLADKCMTVVDGALERMRVEHKDDSPPPAVDPVAWSGQAPEVVIQDRRASPLD